MPFPFRFTFFSRLIRFPVSLVVASFLAVQPWLSLSPGLVNHVAAAPAGPAGVYVLVTLDDNLSSYRPTKVETYLAQSSVAGVALRIDWSAFEPAPGSYQFAAIDDVLSRAKAHQKNVQLLVVPGFDSPAWLLSELPSCDALLTPPPTPQANPTPPNCGKATFTVPYGQGKGTLLPLPLPWDSTYVTAWHAMVQALATRYNGDPALTAIAVAGPTSVSVEMSLPNGPSDVTAWNGLLALFYPAGPYQNSNNAFIDQWKAAIQFYGTTFQSKTLVVTGGNMVDFVKGPKGDNSTTARTAVWSYFASGGVGVVGTNAKAMQTNGLRASRKGNGGMADIKTYVAASTGIIGGQQFATSVARDTIGMGCVNVTPCSVTPDSAARGTLAVFFDQSADPSGRYCNVDGGCNTQGNPAANLGYLQVYSSDLNYVLNHPSDPLSATLQQANQDILAFAQGG